jgi:hypothetical protein
MLTCAINAHDEGTILTLFADNAVVQTPSGEYRGKAAVQQWARHTIATVSRVDTQAYQRTPVSSTWISREYTNAGEVTTSRNIAIVLWDGTISALTVIPDPTIESERINSAGGSSL